MYLHIFVTSTVVQLKSSASRCDRFALVNFLPVNIAYEAICNTELVWVLWRKRKLCSVGQESNSSSWAFQFFAYRRTGCYGGEACNCGVFENVVLQPLCQEQRATVENIVKIAQSVRRKQIGNMNYVNMKEEC